MIGIAGKILIHNLPFRFNFLTIACRAASICLDVIVPDLIVFNPTVPNFNWLEQGSNCRKLPFCIFLYLVFLGCNNLISKILIFS